MERLTEEKQIGPFASLKDKAEAVPGAFGTYDCLYAHMVAVTRLKQYEDTGLEPEEVTELMAAHGTAILDLSEYRSIGPTKHLKELAQAEKDGRMVVLPCKPDATAYQWKKGDDISSMFRLSGVGIDEDGEITYKTYWGETFTPDDFGKIVFLTRSEAEAALQKREETCKDESV